jgi:hypothetical protein
VEVSATVAIWMTITIVFHLQHAHNLLGIPIIVAFQLGLRRQPLRTLWVRDGDPFRLDAWGWLLALLIALYPSYRLYTLIHSGGTVVKLISAACAVVGAIPARRMRCAISAVPRCVRCSCVWELRAGSGFSFW